MQGSLIDRQLADASGWSESYRQLLHLTFASTKDCVVSGEDVCLLRLLVPAYNLSQSAAAMRDGG